MQNVKFGVVWWIKGSPKVTANVTIQQSAYDFFNFNRNYASILYHFRANAGYLSKVTYFNLLHLHLVPTNFAETFGTR